MSRMQRLSASSSSENDFFAFNEEDTASFNFDTEVIEYLKIFVVRDGDPEPLQHSDAV